MRSQSPGLLLLFKTLRHLSLYLFEDFIQYSDATYFLCIKRVRNVEEFSEV